MASSVYEILNDVWDATNHALKTVFSMIHTHQSSAQGGTLDHGAALTGLTDDDHTQYVLESTLTAAGDIAYATGASTWTRLAKGAANTFLKMNSGATAPEWSSIGVGEITVVRKTSDETVNNSTVLQNDNELFLPIAANEVWFFEMRLLTNSSAAADFKTTITLPSGAAGFAHSMGTDSAGAQQISYQTWTLDWQGVAGNLGSPILNGIVINGANAGNIQLQWAQQFAEASDTKVLTNSCIIAIRLN